ncbi:hypothetical protein [Parasitella parasitica]|uniref:Protein PNS1 n=1 Tax=Parasitella parasitica TaxID=35722 RepID=A0A0B7N5X9_9FUNG|nr:hypothetical protein [Parasitella parasitica]
MDQESENEEEEVDNAMPHSLFYSFHQNQHNINEDSIPLTESNVYSDRSQLLFEQDNEIENEGSDLEESPKPSAIYLDQPSVSTLDFANPSSLSDSLLPTSASIPPGITTTKDKKYRDPIFAVLYAICFIVFLLSGVILLLTTNSHIIEDYVKGSTFKTIRDSAGILSIIVAIALIIGVSWLHILRSFTKIFVWGTVICIPITLTLIFIWTLVESLQSNFVYEGEKQLSAKDTGLTVMSFVPLTMNLLYIKMVFDNKHRIKQTVSVIELACDVVRFNPGTILVSFILLVIFIAFSILWIIFFNRLWLLGHSADKSSIMGTVWVVNNYVYALAAFYVVFYMWTAKLLVYMERFSLAAITAHWYFHRNDRSPTTTATNLLWKNVLVKASTTSFGTLAFGSLILAIIQFLQFIARYIRKYSKTARPFTTVFSFILRYIDAIVSTFSNYTISLAGITGESFCSAATSATKIFRRNLLTGLFGDLLTQLILYTGASVIALSSGFGAYVYATHSLHSPHGFVVGLIGTLMPWYLSQFFSYIMTSIIDASFLCYAIDLDTGMVHLSAAHNAFSGFD